MEISYTYFSVSIGVGVFKFCIYLQEGEVYCVSEKKDANPHFAFFLQLFIFSLCLSYIMNMDIFSVKDFSATT